MLPGSREAPTTATPRGRKRGRSDATVAMRSRISLRATLSGLGWTSRLTTT